MDRCTFLGGRELTSSTPRSKIWTWIILVCMYVVEIERYAIVSTLGILMVTRIKRVEQARKGFTMNHSEIGDRIEEKILPAR